MTRIQIARALRLGFVLLLTACTGQVEPEPEPPTCTEHGFQMSVGQTATMHFDADVRVFVVGGEADIVASGRDVSVTVLSSDDSTPRVLAVGGTHILAAEVRACAGSLPAWPTSMSVTP